MDDKHPLAIACKKFLKKNHGSIKKKFQDYLINSPFFKKAVVNNRAEFTNLLAYIASIKKIKNVYYVDEYRRVKTIQDVPNPDTLAEYHENISSVVVYRGFNEDKFCKEIKGNYSLTDYGEAIMVHELCHHFFAEEEGKFLSLVQLCLSNILVKPLLALIGKKKREFNEGLADLVAKVWFSKYVIFYRRQADFVCKKILGRK